MVTSEGGAGTWTVMSAAGVVAGRAPAMRQAKTRERFMAILRDSGRGPCPSSEPQCHVNAGQQHVLLGAVVERRPIVVAIVADFGTDLEQWGKVMGQPD